jgi:hypothetical protein
VDSSDEALAVGEVLALQFLAMTMDVRIQNFSYL